MNTDKILKPDEGLLLHHALYHCPQRTDFFHSPESRMGRIRLDRLSKIIFLLKHNLLEKENPSVRISLLDKSWIINQVTSQEGLMGCDRPECRAAVSGRCVWPLKASKSSGKKDFI